MRCLALLLLLSLPACAQSTLLEETFQKIYGADYAGAQATIGRYIAEQPNDPLGYAAKGSALLFGELDRLGLLESEFFESDHKVSESSRNLHPDKQARDGFYAAVNRAQSLAQAILDKHPDDTHALFAMSLSLGEQVDYLALIEKKQIASLSVNKRAYREAKHLLRVDPHYTDAYLTTGFTEYLVGTLPRVFRWLVKFDDVQGSKDEGFRNLRLVADHGHYLKPLAKILLATGYLREKRPREARTLLAELTREYPSNPLLKREYDKVFRAGIEERFASFLPVRSARELAFDILLQVDRGGYAADLLLAETAGLESRDAGLASTIVLGVLRYRAQIDFAIRQSAGRSIAKLDPEVLAALRIGVFQLRYLDRIPAHAAWAAASIW